ncbi:MAG TPA: hypothetical protein VF275_10045 [Gammaproteobacteria bacterium]
MGVHDTKARPAAECEKPKGKIKRNGRQKKSSGLASIANPLEIVKETSVSGRPSVPDLNRGIPASVVAKFPRSDYGN